MIRDNKRHKLWTALPIFFYVLLGVYVFAYLFLPENLPRFVFVLVISSLITLVLTKIALRWQDKRKRKVKRDFS